jgi:hypothetical protein
MHNPTKEEVHKTSHPDQDNQDKEEGPQVALIDQENNDWEISS